MYAVFSAAISFAKLLLLVAIGLLLLLALLFYTKAAIGRFFPQFVQIGTFADINDGSKDLSAALISRADELGRPVSLDALFEVKVPPIANNFGAQDNLKFLEDTKLSFQGVDVPGVIRALISALPDDHYTITAKPGNLGATGPVLNVEFREPSGSTKTWLLRIEQPPASAAALSAAATTSQVIDRAIYTIWHHMYYDPKGLQWRRKDLEANFISARALEAYYGGQQRLASYQRAFQASELDAAEKEFRLLTSEMPQFVPGWMLLGTTLLEKRNERDAIRALDRAQQLLAPNGTLPADATVSDKKTWLQARLFTAIARLQMYDWKNNHEALRILEAALSDIPNSPPAGMTRQDFYDLRKIQFSILFQIAHSVGHDLILLKEDSFVGALTEPPNAPPNAKVPVSVMRLTDRQKVLQAHEKAVQEATDPAQLAAAKAQRATDFREEIDELFTKQKASLKRADDFLKEIDDLVNDDKVKPAEQLNKEEWKRARERLVADLRNAEGYARYRHAQLRQADDKLFKEECDAALAKLLEGQTIRPNEYTIIQNIGLIYGDPRYDPEGKDLDTAQALFARSLEIKSRDYYGYQRLAALALRQAYERGPEFAGLEAIKTAIGHVEKARELRPGDGTTLVLLAQLYTLKWAKTADPDRQEAASLIEAALALEPRGRRASPYHVRIAELQWQLVRLRTATKDDFGNAKTKLLGKLQSAKDYAEGSPRWDARDLVARTTSLIASLQSVEFEGRATLRWPN